MTDRERFERAFAPVHASADTVTEVLKMTDANRKPKRAGAARLAARVALIAAIIFVLLTGSAYAASLYVNSPEQAWKTAQREIQKMKDMGILSQEVQIDGKAERIIETGRSRKARTIISGGCSSAATQLRHRAATGSITSTFQSTWRRAK